MIFTYTAAIIDTLLIKTSVYAIEKTVGAIWYTTKYVYNYYNDSNCVDIEHENEHDYLIIEIKNLKKELNNIKNKIHID